MTVDDLIAAPQYTVSRADKEALFPALLAEAFRASAARSPEFAGFLRKARFEPAPDRPLADFPPLPVSMFKHFVLRTCAEGEVVRELRSSGTTGQAPSRIFLDKATLHRQSRALVAILKSHLGTARRPYLVLDVPEANDPAQAALTARGAAIRGFSSFASETVYALRAEDGRPVLDWPAVEAFARAHADREVLVFGFTFLVWSIVLAELEARGARLRLPGATLFHGGGWKRLAEQAVSKAAFTAKVAELLGCRPARVLDYYGMVEQVGSIFVDCEAGQKHPPNFGTVLVRDPLTFAVQPLGREGLIEVVSLLPSSYPGHVLLTEDQGVRLAEDDCPCGRRDVAFRFTARVEQAEIRGCGDVFAHAHRPRPG